MLMQKSINSYGPIEDPSPRFVRRISNLGNTEDLLSYKATVNFIATSKYSFARSDFDPYLLSLLKVIMCLFACLCFEYSEGSFTLCCLFSWTSSFSFSTTF